MRKINWGCNYCMQKLKAVNNTFTCKLQPIVNLFEREKQVV